MIPGFPVVFYRNSMQLASYVFWHIYGWHLVSSRSSDLVCSLWQVSLLLFYSLQL
jgi:hypothetical protein